MDLYFYEGPVEEFGRCVERNWKAKTSANSEAKAFSNLKYQYKKRNGKLPSCKIDLPGKITKID